MRILVVDNEELAVRTLCNTINKVIPDADITSVTDSREALDAAFKIRPEIAFLDIDMPGVNGLMLAKAIKEQVDPKTNIISFLWDSPPFEKTGKQIENIIKKQNNLFKILFFNCNSIFSSKSKPILRNIFIAKDTKTIQITESHVFTSFAMIT